MKALINFVVDLFAWIFGLVRNAAVVLFEKFLDINIFEKGVVIATILAFAAIVMPVAQYYIFEQYFTINNPIAHYLIGITAIMLVTVYVPGFISMLARIGLNVLYLIGAIYLHLAREISKAPYEILPGYYLNIAVPVVYIVLSAVSWLAYREN
jgi:hypothetical protein